MPRGLWSMASEPLMVSIAAALSLSRLQCSKSCLCYWKEHSEVRPRLDHLGDDHDYSTSRRFGAQFPLRRPTNAPHIRRQAGLLRHALAALEVPATIRRTSKSPVTRASAETWTKILITSSHGALVFRYAKHVHFAAGSPICDRLRAVETSGRTSSRVVPLNPFLNFAHCIAR